MADANYVRFSKRLRDIDARHRKLRSGYVRLEERNGLLIPVERVRVGRNGLPVRGLVLALGTFLVFKAFLLAYLGPITYLDRVGQLESGNIVEQMGAWAMRVDVITLWISEQIAQLF